jgi:hypothetical protein
VSLISLSYKCFHHFVLIRRHLPQRHLFDNGGSHYWRRFSRACTVRRTRPGAVNLAGAQRDRGVQGLGGLGVGGMGQAAAVSSVTSLKTANRRVISVR